MAAVFGMLAMGCAALAQDTATVRIEVLHEASAVAGASVVVNGRTVGTDERGLATVAVQPARAPIEVTTTFFYSRVRDALQVQETGRWRRTPIVSVDARTFSSARWWTRASGVRACS